MPHQKQKELMWTGKQCPLMLQILENKFLNSRSQPDLLRL